MKNIDYVNNIIAERKGIDKNIVKAVNKYYWNKGVRKKLSSLESTAVFIKGFTTIVVSRYNLRRAIFKTIRQIRRIRESVKFKEENRLIYLDVLAKRLEKLLIKRNELAKLYYHEFYRIRKANTDSNTECG